MARIVSTSLLVALTAALAAPPARAERRRAPRLTDGAIELPRPVAFRTGGAELLPESEALLDRVAALLRDNPSVTVEVEVHSDSRGSSEWNYRLTSARAVAVRDALVQRGVEASRLTAQGYGESCPVAEGVTAAAAARNRRVVLRRTDRPVPRTCEPPPPPLPPEEREVDQYQQ